MNLFLFVVLYVFIGWLTSRLYSMTLLPRPEYAEPGELAFAGMFWPLCLPMIMICWFIAIGMIVICLIAIGCLKIFEWSMNKIRTLG